MAKTLGIGLMGTGRIAHVYAPKVQADSRFRLEAVYNPKLASAEKATALYGGRPTDDVDVLLADSQIDAVIIATPTNTHVEYIEKAAKAGKPIYCEKPLDQTLDRVDYALDILDRYKVPFMLGFNRRFDPDNAALAQGVRDGKVGRLNMLSSTSREPSPPPIDYVKSSGGYFVDASIHDIDLLCWIAGEYPIEVTAYGSCVFDTAIGKNNDFDLTMTVLKFPSGALAHINNSRQCAYGFDQRVEAFGTDGLLQTQNHRDENLLHWGKNHTCAQSPLQHFFLERYDESFGLALGEFYDAVTQKRMPSATAQDGRKALAVALACDMSAKTGRSVSPDYAS